ncbi:ParB/RepB/Spo0J family partition protein [Roseospirillum parvum]|uniref:ParB-like nuclease domain-containing protein n=1 Tax=Roseospirillum parvum TaxID=83401 RepID=A0A1G8EHQ6_9PROT|nr:ParB/RepB/Spo0J family partition protein [Roseospirillum parvum]SDH69406.1 ParB-like nuclease domain-containing protein [Roseospirillum parvum]
MTGKEAKTVGIPEAVANEEEEWLAFEPLDLLEKLKARAEREPEPEVRPGRLPLSEIELHPDLFQPRGMDERHISELQRAIKAGGRLDPLLVAQVGRSVILLDGHHRVAAYESSGVTNDIPVEYFNGTLEQAVLAAGRANSKAKLPMSTQERQNYAWRLVLLGKHSKKQIAKASGASDGSIAIMRRVKRELGEEAFGFKFWFEAMNAHKGLKREELSDEDREARLEVQAADYADRLSREFSTKLATNPTLAARTFAIYFGRNLPDLVHELGLLVPEEVDGENDDF